MQNVTRAFQKSKFHRNLKNVEWKNIRIQLDYNYIDTTKDDGHTCKRKGQQVTYQRTSFTCTDDQVLSKSKIKAIKGTLNNVKTYLEKLLYVIPYDSKIKYKDYVRWYGKETDFGLQSATGVDIVLPILSRPRRSNDATLASAVALSLAQSSSRPIFGVVFLNPQQVPTEIQNENSKDCRFFYTCVHEIFHALGISGSLYNAYHPHESTDPHPQITCSIRKYGRNFKFLVTPYAHKYAVKRFGVEKFIGDNGECPSGLEIEDGGGSGTAGSHLEARTYMSDLMVGATIQTQSGPFSRLTDAVLAILLDTGNYKVNWKMGQPLVWGNPESIDGKQIKNFAIGPPQTVFPKYYMRDFSKQEMWYESFDFKFSGPTPGRVSLQVSNELLQFYDPKGIGVSDVDVYDYIPFYFPNNVCPKGQAILPSTNLQYHKCGEYSCNEYESFTIKVNKDERGTQWEDVTCTKENASQVISKPFRFYARKISCVDPERFCRSVKLNEMKFVVDPFKAETMQLDSNSSATIEPESGEDQIPSDGDNAEKPGTGEMPGSEEKPGSGETPGSGSDENKSSNGENGGTNGSNGKEGGSSNEEKDKKKKLIIIGVCAGVAALIVIVIVAVFVGYAIRNAKEQVYHDDSDANYIV
ncbi:GP63-like [Trichomonas vaginalis G3]|uniref:GP63-like n=1 Tax=Trichomonas vaginalis (strain ATCC PRA-98 / G3) TaxID=412133 RepID=A2ER93_TRIV3|nr:regulation of choline O-acetyltransferase protein [Trichomonas vaginalis G3]EAY04846.1 GP63-like [Trichomonas vaginalis G3]KAI5535368.1 regulation of choline O-acetyltransferase protein [Trichomonas vaginalis G3]|eukprot:XP_001317069.1 GP63-like [Trichomonas vaginalis G3]